ncbi:MAG: TatD family hydrolase [Clostridia bacterium]|nr:TatD family hydrolase [Clostridia bacterium]
MPAFIDTHAHYFDRKYAALTEGGDPSTREDASREAALVGADTLLSSPDFQSVVCGVINVGTNLENSRVAVEQAGKYPFMAAAVGIHPEDAQGLPDGAPLDPDTTLAALEAWVSDPVRRKADKIVAIGETGLDYYWQPVNKELQKVFFEGQMEIARRTGLPVIIHDREAHGDCFETVLKYPDVRGVFHCYSGSAEMAKELSRRGWYIAFGGTSTFPTAHRVREAVAAVPLSRLLLETDCPYMAPVPFRGRLNHSGLIPHIAEVIAPLHGVTVEDLAEVVNANAETLFGLSAVLR